MRRNSVGRRQIGCGWVHEQRGHGPVELWRRRGFRARSVRGGVTSLAIRHAASLCGSDAERDCRGGGDYRADSMGQKG
jgi:hypothetical protein